LPASLGATVDGVSSIPVQNLLFQTNTDQRRVQRAKQLVASSAVTHCQACELDDIAAAVNANSNNIIGVPCAVCHSCGMGIRAAVRMDGCRLAVNCRRRQRTLAEMLITGIIDSACTAILPYACAIVCRDMVRGAGRPCSPARSVDDGNYADLRTSLVNVLVLAAACRWLYTASTASACCDPHVAR
jgi:hypothetical protein